MIILQLSCNYFMIILPLFYNYRVIIYDFLMIILQLWLSCNYLTFNLWLS